MSAYGETMSEGSYYLASAADKIYLNPEGEVEFNGMVVEIGFYKRLFDKLDIKPEIFRVGEFKSAVEPFILDKMSDANRLQLTELINSIYNHVLARISETRNIPQTKLKEISDKMLVRNAAASKELGLVDSLLYEDEFRGVIQKHLGISSDEKISFVKYSKYRKSFTAESKTTSNEIAVIVAEGTIMPGKSTGSEPMIGADTYVEEIRKARENNDVNGVWLTVGASGSSARRKSS